MLRYNTGPTAMIDDTATALLLRVDLEIAFNKSRLACVPKLATNGSVRPVAHLHGCSTELEHLYHHRKLHPPQST
jgi:hypothetical protein